MYYCQLRSTICQIVLCVDIHRVCAPPHIGKCGVGWREQRNTKHSNAQRLLRWQCSRVNLRRCGCSLKRLPYKRGNDKPHAIRPCLGNSGAVPGFWRCPQYTVRGFPDLGISNSRRLESSRLNCFDSVEDRSGMELSLNLEQPPLFNLLVRMYAGASGNVSPRQQSASHQPAISRQPRMLYTKSQLKSRLANSNSRLPRH